VLERVLVFFESRVTVGGGVVGVGEGLLVRVLD
jgi:hypothetical protein